jgi:hypothetical protein
VEVFYDIEERVVDMDGDKGCRGDVANESEGKQSRNFVMKSPDRLCDNTIAKTDNIVLLLLLLLLLYLYL